MFILLQSAAPVGLSFVGRLGTGALNLFCDHCPLSVKPGRLALRVAIGRLEWERWLALR